MAFFDNIKFPFFTMQELNLDWLLKEVKRIAGFMPQGGNVGDILTRKSDGAEWEPPEAVNINIDALPQDTQIMDNDQLIFYDISAQANRKIKPPDLLDSMCSNGTPLMNGTGAAGTSKKPARYDHVHPTDTSRAPANYFQNGNLKVANGGTGASNAADALVNLGATVQTGWIGESNISTSSGTVLSGSLVTYSYDNIFVSVNYHIRLQNTTGRPTVTVTGLPKMGATGVTYPGNPTIVFIGGNTGISDTTSAVANGTTLTISMTNFIGTVPSGTGDMVYSGSFVVPAVQ